ncbi:hypothetical protein [Halorubrum sp. Atlit-8R]|uniref:hypothetical protein n=1 Tax=Halorubrum sp. Atlit-8R TaxID=2282126 RepID=UPI0011C47F6F|nr:hypothetical protein [Halorubrum sp. Atlit-8R]
MSAISTHQDDEAEGLEWAARHRDELEREANSDLPHAWMAERILQRLEEEEEDDESDEEAGGS